MVDKHVVSCGDTVDVVTYDGDSYRADVVAVATDRVMLKPTRENGGGAAGCMSPEQRSARWVAWSDIDSMSAVVPDDGYTVPVDVLRRVMLGGSVVRLAVRGDESSGWTTPVRVVDIVDDHVSYSPVHFRPDDGGKSGVWVFGDAAPVPVPVWSVVGYTVVDDPCGTMVGVDIGHDSPPVGVDVTPAFVDAFARFRDAVSDMAREWESGDVAADIFGDTYPACLPSFGDFSAMVDDMSFDTPAFAPTAPRLPVAGERVVWTRVEDSRGHMGGAAIIPVGTTGMIVRVDHDGGTVEIRPDDANAQDAYAEWDGCIVYTTDDGYADALDVFGGNDDALTDAWSPITVAAFAAWRMVAPVAS